MPRKMPIGTVSSANRIVVHSESTNSCEPSTSAIWSNPTYLLGNPGNGGTL